MIRLAALLILIAAPALADDLYDDFRRADQVGRYKWALSMTKMAWPDESIGRQKRIAAYIVGCSEEYAPDTGAPFQSFAALCAALAKAEVD